MPPLFLTGLGFTSLSPHVFSWCLLISTSHKPNFNLLSPTPISICFPSSACLSSSLLLLWASLNTDSRAESTSVCHCSHLAATTRLPACCPSHSMTSCGTAVWDTLGGCLLLPSSSGWPPAGVWFSFFPILFFPYSSSLLASCHFGIISLSCKGKGVKYRKISKAISRLAVLPLALCITRHRSGRVPGT